MKKIFLPLLFVTLTTINLTAQKEAKQNQFMFEAENVFEAALENKPSDGIGYQGFENELEFMLGINHTLSDELSVYGQLSSYTDILNNPDGSFAFAEQENAAGVGVNWSKLEEVQIDFSFNLIGNFRPNELVRVGPGVSLTFSGESQKAWISYEISNSFNHLFGSREDHSPHYMLADVLNYLIIFNCFNFIKDDINLGLYVEGEVDSESIFTINGNNSKVIETEFFTGLTYSPIEQFSFNCEMSLYHTHDKGENSLDIGMKTGIAYAGDKFGFNINYIPHLYSKTDSGQQPISHAIEAVLTVGL